MPPKVIAFDVFGTVFDLSDVDRSEVRAYVEHIKQPTWEPLNLPKHWETLPAHYDAPGALEMLRKKYMVVTLSNGPMRLLAELNKFNGLKWDAIIPLEMARVYKPNPIAYLLPAQLFDCDINEVMMVTANKDFGDIEAAKALGMQWFWIDRKNGGTIYDVVEALQ